MTDKNPYMMVCSWRFQCKIEHRYANDNRNIEGSKIDILTASFGFNQIINEPTHILNNPPSCITTESSNGIRCSFFSPRKFSSSNNICKV